MSTDNPFRTLTRHGRSCVEVTLSPVELIMIKDMRKYTPTYTTSHLGQRTDEERESQWLLGQLGEAALSKFLTGDIYLYITTRFIKNEFIHKGENDGGVDLMFYEVDIKTTRKAVPDHVPLKVCKLFISKRELNTNIVYVYAMASFYNNNSVTLIGWATADMLLKNPFDRNKFGVDETKLRPMSEFYAKRNPSFPQFCDKGFKG